MSSQVFLECKCTEEKKHRLVFDGGSKGQYMIDMCDRCDLKEDKEFLIHSQTIEI